MGKLLRSIIRDGIAEKLEKHNLIQNSQRVLEDLRRSLELRSLGYLLK